MDQGRRVEPILRALPSWFGIESALRQFVDAADVEPTFCVDADGEAIGFLTLRRHFDAAAEILAMGVVPGSHRSGAGRALVEAAEAWLRTQGVAFLQVKTLSASSDDPHYARTRSFFRALGFTPLEEIKTLWDEHNPCLILIKTL